jgi:hypothetical protein
MIRFCNAHIILIAVLLVASLSFADENWETTVQSNGLRTARSVALATTPNGSVASTLVFECQPGSDGTLSVVYTIHQPQKVILFPFEQFEGPDAPAATKKLGQIQVHLRTGKAISKVTLQKELSGYYATADAFAFSFSVPAGQKNEVTQLMDKIIQGAGTISFCVLTDTPVKICSDFILRASGKKIGEMVEPCL